VKIIDVRTPEELLCRPPGDGWNIPLAFVTYQGKEGKIEHGSKMNPDFVAGVNKIAGPTDTLLLMCRSGGAQPWQSTSSRQPASKRVQHH